MKVLHETQSTNDSNCTIRIGKASWDENEMSIKYAWKDKNGKVARGGEVPVSALKEMVAFAKEKKVLK